MEKISTDMGTRNFLKPASPMAEFQTWGYKLDIAIVLSGDGTIMRAVSEICPEGIEAHIVQINKELKAVTCLINSSNHRSVEDNAS